MQSHGKNDSGAKISSEKSAFGCVGGVDARNWRRDAMPLGVKGEVIGTRESASAVRAAERAVSGVFSAVSSQLVRPRKLPSAAWPLARVRLLTYTHT